MTTHLQELRAADWRPSFFAGARGAALWRLRQERQTAEHRSGRLAIWQCFYFDFFCVPFFFFAMALLLDV